MVGAAHQQAGVVGVVELLDGVRGALVGVGVDDERAAAAVGWVEVGAAAESDDFIVVLVEHGESLNFSFHGC